MNGLIIGYLALSLLKNSSHGIEFLNSFVYCGQDNKLLTKPYSKACDEHTYLVPTSCHPAHNIRNIPYSTAMDPRGVRGGGGRGGGGDQTGLRRVSDGVKNIRF